MTLSDKRQAMPKDSNISAIPATVIKPTGTVKVHFNMPRLLKKTLNSGFMTRLLTKSPTTVERIIAGINESAVCKMSCFVVKPSDFKIP